MTVTVDSTCNSDTSIRIQAGIELNFYFVQTQDKITEDAITGSLLQGLDKHGVVSKAHEVNLSLSKNCCGTQKEMFLNR